MPGASVARRIGFQPQISAATFPAPRAVENGGCNWSLDRAQMAYDPDVSPVGWYLASYLLGFVELGDKRRNDPDARFLTWENFVIIKARSMDEALRKAVKRAQLERGPYKGGLDESTAVRVKQRANELGRWAA